MGLRFSHASTVAVVLVLLGCDGVIPEDGEGCGAVPPCVFDGDGGPGPGPEDGSASDGGGRPGEGGPDAGPDGSLGDGGVGPEGMVHPGIGLSRAQLDFVKGKVATGAEPWKGAYAKLQGSYLTKLSHVPEPVAEVRCAAGTGRAYMQAHPE
ncbi:MAG: hypothetical protein KC416_17545, partial [Myxococcales bacterium]|nr:hypothetical protein [Myxococcales bacterium]